MRTYLRLLQYARQQQGFLAVAFLLTVAASALAALQPWPMKLLVDHVLGTDPMPSWLKQLPNNPGFLIPAIVMAGLLTYALSSVIDATLAWRWTASGRRMVYDLAQDLFARLQRRSLLFHKRASVGDLIGRISVDSWSVYQVADALLFAPAHALITMMAMTFLMITLDPGLTKIALGIAPLMVIATLVVGKPLRMASRLKREIETRIQSHIQQTLTGIPVVQAFGQEERESLRFQGYADAAIRNQQRTALLASINGLITGLITTLGSGAVLWIGARHVPERLSVGGILVFLVYLGSLQAQMKTLVDLYNTLQGLSGASERVIEILDAEPEVKEVQDAKPLPATQGRIQFDDVCFGYGTGPAVLRNVSFQVQPGQMIGIVGATGAGKSSLVNLLPRFADPTSGRVLLDGRDVREFRLRELRAQISLVMQESFLLPFSVLENIGFGKPGASRQEVETAARAARAHEFITALPHGYDTIIGERGATLSGGERQRLAIARAFLKDAPILILDEPTSALDAVTEHEILDALERLTLGRTTLVVAHRLSTVRRADLILVLENGAIVESGPHDALILRGGGYARLHRLQREPLKEISTTSATL